jgi:hypothetical protein
MGERRTRRDKAGIIYSYGNAGNYTILPGQFNGAEKHIRAG